MKKNYLNLLITASLFLSIVTPHINAEKKPRNSKTSHKKNHQNNFKLTKKQEVLNEIIVEEIDNFIVQATDQLKQIDSQLEELAQIILNGIIKTKNRARLILKIKSLRRLISKFANAPYAQADLQTINFLLTINKYLIENIYVAVKNGLKEIPEIKIEQMIPKTRITSSKQLKQKLKQNKKIYDKLEKAVQNVGLSWTNWLYRKLIVAPAKTAKKLYVPTIAKYSLIGGLGATYILYRFSSQLTDILGEPPKMDKYGDIENEDELGPLGQLESKIVGYTSGRMPIAKLFVTFVAPILFYKEFVKIKKWVTNKATQIHYKLMGGIEGKNAKDDYHNETPRYKFTDVVGLEHVKQELKPVIEYIKNCARFERVGIGPEKGYLFAGKPGTGKSFMAEALAGEILAALTEIGQSSNKFKFIPFEASEILEIIRERGVSDGIDAILNYAKKNAPCIVFIDEPDLLGLQRTSNRDLLSKLLNAMNGFLSNNMSDNIILLAATNRPDNLDPALLRRGRLGKIIYFEYPSFESRKKYFHKKLFPIVADTSEFDLEKLARETEGCTFEAIQSVIRKAFQVTKIKGVSLRQKDLEIALNQEIRQILTDTKNISKEEQKIIAANQAACALSNILLDPSNKLACVTINPVMRAIRESCVWDRYYKQEQSMIQAGKIFTKKDKDTVEVYSYDEKIKKCKIKLAGPIGEEILLGNCGYSYDNESQQEALNIALSLVSEGINLKNIPKYFQEKYYVKAMEIIETCKKELRELLEQNKQHLENIYNTLLEEKTLDADQVKEIIYGKNESKLEQIDLFESGLFADFE